MHTESYFKVEQSTVNLKEVIKIVSSFNLTGVESN